MIKFIIVIKIFIFFFKNTIIEHNNQKYTLKYFKFTVLRYFPSGQLVHTLGSVQLKQFSLHFNGAFIWTSFGMSFDSIGLLVAIVVESK
jgi:hypothetical protein